VKKESQGQQQVGDEWYVLANDKLPLRETLYRQGRVDSPDCLECLGQKEDLTHKYTTCQHSIHIWAFMQNRIREEANALVTFNDMAFPVLPNPSRANKRKAIEIFAIFLNFMENVHARNRSIPLLKLNLDNK
jgi:hypothetical protein